ncbi:MAG: sensor histidine kinase [Asticcacaulis sp.]
MMPDLPIQGGQTDLIGKLRLTLMALCHRLLSFASHRPDGVAWHKGLSAQLFGLTVVFVLAVEIFILIPSLAAFQEGWLTDRLRQAEIASLALDAAPDNRVTESLARQLLRGAGVEAVAFQVDGARRLMQAPRRITTTPDFIDLRQQDTLGRLVAPWQTFAGGDARLIRVMAKPRVRPGEFIEIVVPARPLKAELTRYLVSILGLTLLISVAAGGLVYAALAFFIVRPVQKLTQSIEKFRANPTDEAAMPGLSGRVDEIGHIEQELAQMQDEVRQALKAQTRLAALGQAVAKINHDLRNMLTAAQMASDRLATSGDPRVAQALPRLERALDRALQLAENVLNYSRSEEPAPQIQSVHLRPLVLAVLEDCGLDPESRPVGLAIHMEVAEALTLPADPEHLHRILVNLIRNAVQVLRETRPGTGILRLSAQIDSGKVRIRVADNGPGVPMKIQDRLFQPFSGSMSPGGSGLGLAIARELARGQGGELIMESSSDQGAVFALDLPAAD